MGFADNLITSPTVQK